MQRVHLLPHFSIAGQRNKYVGISTAPARKKFKYSSPPNAGA